MSSCLWLERPALWRPIALAGLLTLISLPAWPLVWQTGLDGAAPNLGSAFWAGMRNSGEIAVYVAVLAMAVGLPAGLVVALYEFPGRRLFLAAMTVPMLVPSLLWAIGWSALTGRLGHPAASWFNSSLGCCLAFLATAAPLVLWITYAATTSLSGSQVESARIAGGERTVLRFASRYVVVTAAMAAGLAGVLSMSDPGPGQILGRRSAASEVLASFASQFDYGLAGRQCLALTALVLAFVAPPAMLAARRLSSQILVRQVRPLRRVSLGSASSFLAAVCGMLISFLVILPLIGLLLPLRGGVDLARACGEVVRTGPNTLLYALGTGLFAAVLGLLAVLCIGRSTRMRAVALGVCVALFALPPSLGALGAAQAATSAPPWLDWLVRSRATVCIELALRLFPIATIIALRSWGSLPATWTQTAALHGVPARKFLARVVLPHMLPALAAAVLLIGLLAAADVSTMLLLHPPGQASLPLAIFTVMANAPESLVASLCLLYVVLALAVVFLLLALPGSDRP
jgi:iron(III) transport system permease protein